MTGLTVFLGCVILSVLLGLTDGTYSRVIDGFARGWTGHVQVHHRDFNGACYVDTAIGDAAGILGRIHAAAHVAGATARTKVPMFISAGAKSGNVFVIGMDPAAEARVFALDKRVRAGRYLRGDETHSIMLGQDLLERLGLRLGDAVVLLGYGADGSLSNGKYQVVGTISTGDPERDAGYAYLPLTEASELAALDSRVQEIAIVARSEGELDAMATSLDSSLSPLGLKVQTWREFALGFYRAMQADASTKSLAVLIVSCVVGLGVWNTMLMNVLERFREFSLMRALGTSRAFVGGLIFVESLLLTLPFALTGTAAGAAINHWLSTRGIPLDKELSYGGMQFDALFTTISARSLYLPMLCVAGTALLVAAFSATQAMRVAPAAGMRGR